MSSTKSEHEIFSKPGWYTKQISLHQVNMHDGHGNCEELLDPKHKDLLDNHPERIYRVGTRAICPECGKEWIDHPMIVGASWLREACNGDGVKV